MNMDALSPFILSLVTFIPAGGGLLILLIPRRDRDIKLFALVISMLAFIASLHLPVHLHRESGAFGYEIDKIWIASPNIHYHMGIDGISMWLVVLTGFLAPLGVLASWNTIKASSGAPRTARPNPANRPIRNGPTLHSVRRAERNPAGGCREHALRGPTRAAGRWLRSRG